MEAQAPPISGILNPPCPWLPELRGIHDFTITRRHGADKGPAFYQDALEFAQSQWLSGKPAQAVLQLDKAWMADIPEGSPVLLTHPSPWRALRWILEMAADGSCGYLGNPVRHFQHLASRMSGPRAEIRSWRAWAAMHVAEKILGSAGFPRDGRQMVREGLWIPGMEAAIHEIDLHGWQGEADLLRDAMECSHR